MGEHMKYFFISFLNLNYDGRTIELVNILKQLSNFIGVTRGNSDVKQSNDHLVCDNNISYFKFLLSSIRHSRKYTDIDIVFADNRKSIFPALYMVFTKRVKYIIYDMREFYLADKSKSIKSKIGSFFEKIMLRNADLVICANSERTEFVKKHFKNKGNVFTYENIRKLNYSQNVDFDTLYSKYSKFFEEKKFRIVSTSGTSIERGNDKLVRASLNEPTNIEIFLVGRVSETERNEIERIINENSLKNIRILNNLNHDELKYIISKCDCGVVNYHSKDLNNKFCASGKLYEFIFEGKPVITTSNPPLVNLCNKYEFGCSGENYNILIENMMENYQRYKNNAEICKDIFSIEENNQKLKMKIINTVNWIE